MLTDVFSADMCKSVSFHKKRPIHITEVGRAILNKIFFGVLGPRMHVWLCKDALT